MLKLIVTIFHGQDKIGAKDRPLYKLPNGEIGVGYQGLVYPLIDKHKIELTGPHFFVDDCPLLLDFPTTWTTKSKPEGQLKWSLDSSGHYHYLLMAGNEALLHEARIGLENIGIEVTKQGPHGDHEDEFNQYIRLGLTEVQPLSSATIEEVLRPLVNRGNQLDNQHSPLTLTTVSETEVLNEKLLAKEKALLKAEKTTIHNEEKIAALTKQLEEQSHKVRRAEKLSEDQAKVFEAARQEFKNQLRYISLPDEEQKELIEKLSEESADLARRNMILDHKAEQLSYDLQHAQESIRDAKKISRDACEQTQKFQTLYEEAEAEIERYRSTKTTAPNTKKLEPAKRHKQTGKLRSILETLLPHIHFVGGSLDFMAIELRDLRNLCQKLDQLGQHSLQGKRVQNTTDWLEVHFNTGTGREGRLYFRKVKNNPTILYEVLASDKHDQPRDIRRLSTHVPLIDNISNT